MWYLAAGLLVFVVPGAYVLRRASKEFEKNGRLASCTCSAALLAYIGHGAFTVLAAWKSVWALPIDRGIASMVGGVLIIFGAPIYVAGRKEFRSFRLTWGLAKGLLVTSGIYRFSRNPQTVGIVFVYGGVALVGGSGAALLLATALLLGSMVWLPVEEEILQRLHGAEYEQYRASTPRYFGWPRDKASRGNWAA